MAKHPPIIGITAHLSPQSDGFEPLLAVEAPYLNSVEMAGGIPLMIPHLQGHPLRELAAKCDGFLFPGGKDLSPARYGEAPHPKLGEISEPLDATELELFKFAVDCGKPILGICRGLQMMNVGCGGALYQDIPSQAPSPVNHAFAETPEQFATLIHPINISPESKLHSILGCAEIGANSHHHQGIKKLGGNLKVAAQSPDGLIEAIELPTARFAIGVQCHPEVLWQSSEARWKNLFEAFISAAC